VVSRDVIAGIVLLAASLGYYVMATRIPTTPLDTTIDSSVLPRWLGIIGTGLSAVLIVQGLLRSRREAAPGRDAMAALWLQHRRALGILAIATAYALLLTTLGYVVSLVLLLAATAWYQARFYDNVRPWPVMLGVPVAGALLFWAIFDLMLGIPMPDGFWQHLW